MSMTPDRQIPTSDPRDSYRAFDDQPPYDPSATYYAYVATRAVPGPVSIQPATITHAPTHGYRNPEFYDGSPLPAQALVAAQGAPPVPFADPGYVYYQLQILRGNGSYQELIGAYAPRVSDGLGVDLSGLGGCD